MVEDQPWLLVPADASLMDTLAEFGAEADAARLEKLGAKRLEKVRTWLVMEAPTGQRFCLVRPQRTMFEAEGNIWD